MDRVRRERDRFVGFVLRDVERIPEADRLRGHAAFRGRPYARRRWTYACCCQDRRHRDRRASDPRGFVRRPRRPPHRQRRCLRLARSAEIRGRDRPGNHRPGAGAGAASTWSSRRGARARRPRRPDQRSGNPRLRHRRLQARNSRWSPTRTLLDMRRDGDRVAIRRTRPIAPSGPKLRLRPGCHRPNAQRPGHRPREDVGQARRQRRAPVRPDDRADRERGRRQGQPDLYRRRRGQLHPAAARGGRRRTHCGRTMPRVLRWARR